MIYLFSGTDRQVARVALDAALKKQKGAIVRVSDAHSLADLSAVLAGKGMFGEERTIVLDGITSGGNAEAREVLLAALPVLKKSSEHFYLLEGSLDAATRKMIEKYAERSERFDMKKKPEDKTIFALANALQRKDKKALWVGLMREYAKGSAPEAVHGLLFWGAKQMALKARGQAELARAHLLLAHLAELPHEARRTGEDASYSLERFVLSGM